MRPIALDTNTYAGFKRGDRDCVEVIQRAEQLLVSTVVLAELLSGFAFGNQEARNRAELRQFLDCVSFDAHFDQVAGLKRISRWAEALP